MNRVLRVLLVEDLETDAERLIDELRHAGYLVAVDRVESPDAMREAVAAMPWDAIASDAMGWSAFIADLSERERLEAELRRSQEQLRQAQKMEAMGSLAGGVAHDFNNLLSVILSYAALAIPRLASGDPLRDQLMEIQEAGWRAAELTRRLLAFCRRQTPQPRVLDLDDLLAEMAKMLRQLIGEDIELTLNGCAGLHKIRGDPGQIEQVVMNLAVNARDAMPRGGTLTIQTRNVELDERQVATLDGTSTGPHVLLEVTDTGCGMDAATQTRIFESFFTTKETGKGTGLGLSTVLGIVQESGVAISVQSAPGAGTTFRMYFVPVDPAIEAEAPAAAGPEAADLRGSETILLVEDDGPVRGAARTILQRKGYRVLEAQSGGDALLLCEQHTASIDLLVTDMVMPRLNGRQLAERLQPLRPEMQVLYISGHADDTVIEHGLLASNVAFLPKPITPAALLRKVRETLDARPKRTS